MDREVMRCTKKKYSKIRVDHQNHNTLDNSKTNLRKCTQSQNMQGMRNQTSKIMSSKYKGVSKVKGKCKWTAYITVNSKIMHIGTFNDEKEAAKQYDIAAIKYFGQYAYLNNIHLNLT